MWGYFDVDAARRRGYHYAKPEPDLEGNKIGPISDSQAGDCFQQSQTAMPLGNGWDRLVGVAPFRDTPSPASDSRFFAAVGTWSNCMKVKGFSTSDPVQLLSDPRWNTPAPTPEEIATATADVDCKIETNLVGVAVAVLKAYDDEYIANHLTELNAFGPMIDKFIRDHQ